MGGSPSRLIPLIADDSIPEEELVQRLRPQRFTYNDLNGSWLEGQSSLHVAVQARRSSTLVGALVDRGANVNRTFSKQAFTLGVVSTVLKTGAAFLLLLLLYVLGSLTSALLIGYFECRPLWWLAWFGVWFIAPVVLAGGRVSEGPNVFALLPVLSIFVSYHLLYSTLWTMAVCTMIVAISGFYIVLSFVEASTGEPFELEAQGWTPLHMACYYGDEEVVRVLVNKGANVRAVDCKGRRPIDVVRTRHQAIADALGP